MTNSDHQTAKMPRRTMSIRDFAWRVAGPRDFIINFIINTTIPFWIFQGLDAVPVTGKHSVASILLPMSLLLGTLTTFFGCFNAIKERRAGTVLPPFVAGTPWAGRAWLSGLATGGLALAVTVTVTFLVSRLAPELTVSYWTAVLGIGFTAGLAGFVLHSVAVERGGTIGVVPGEIAS